MPRHPPCALISLTSIGSVPLYSDLYGWNVTFGYIALYPSGVWFVCYCLLSVSFFRKIRPRMSWYFFLSNRFILFQYAVFKVRMQNRIFWFSVKACFHKKAGIFDFIACLHATEETCFRSAYVSTCTVFSYRMEMERFELLTPCLQGRCSPNWATPPYGCGSSLIWGDPLFCCVFHLLTLTSFGKQWA